MLYLEGFLMMLVDDLSFAECSGVKQLRAVGHCRGTKGASKGVCLRAF